MLPNRAGTAMLIIHNVNEAEIMPKVLSEIPDKTAIETPSLMPSSDNAMVGTIASVK